MPHIIFCSSLLVLGVFENPIALFFSFLSFFGLPSAAPFAYAANPIKAEGLYGSCIRVLQCSCGVLIEFHWPKRIGAGSCPKWLHPPAGPFVSTERCYSSFIDASKMISSSSGSSVGGKCLISELWNYLWPVLLRAPWPRPLSRHLAAKSVTSYWFQHTATLTCKCHRISFLFYGSYSRREFLVCRFFSFHWIMLKLAKSRRLEGLLEVATFNVKDIALKTTPCRCEWQHGLEWHILWPS